MLFLKSLIICKYNDEYCRLKIHPFYIIAPCEYPERKETIREVLWNLRE